MRSLPSSWNKTLAQLGFKRKRRKTKQRDFMRRRPLFESLEPRQMLSITVDTLVDENDGDYSAGDFSLREAIAVAIAGETIDFSPTLFSGGLGTLALTQGELVIDGNLTITGPGADLLTIDAQGTSRVFRIDSADVTLNDLNITGGKDSYGGGISLIDASLTLTNVEVSGNEATASGGGIFNFEGTLNISQSTISGNTAAQYGGGVYSLDGPLTITQSTFSGNDAFLSGGGIHNNEGLLSILQSTIYDNEAGVDGGGVYVDNVSPTAYLDNTMVAGNKVGAADDDVSGDFAGGSYNLIGYIAGSTGLSSGMGTIYGTVGAPLDARLSPLGNYGGPTLTHGLLSDSPAIDKASNALAPLTTDQRGYDRDVDIDFDGPAGGTVDIGAFEYRTSLVVSTVKDESNMDYSSGDLSLREALALAAASVGPDTIEFDSSLFSSGSATILLGDADGSGAIEAGETPTQLVIDSDVIIEGPGASSLTIDGNDTTRVVNVLTGVTAKLDNLTITRGSTTYGGAGIYNSGNLMLEEVVVSANTAGSGAGIYVAATGTLQVSNSTIDDNLASSRGGGISGSFGSGNVLTISNSTISNNTTISGVGGGLDVKSSGNAPVISITNSTFSGNAAGTAGAIWIANAAADVTIVNSTITDNHATAANAVAGGIYNGGTVTLHNTILAGNTAGHAVYIEGWGNLNGTGSSYNLIGTTYNNIGITDGVAGNMVGTSSVPIDPLLSALGDFGGPTNTHAFLNGSPAIDMGSDAYGGPYDQRMHARPFDLPGIGNEGTNTTDIGAFEVGNPTPLTVTVLDDLPVPLELTLREAIDLANAMPAMEIIQFKASLAGGTIHIGSQLPDITSALEIDASGLASGITINAGDGIDGNFATGDGYRIFYIDDGDSQTDLDVTLKGLTITGGDVDGTAASPVSGGAIYSKENLTLDNTTIAGNAVVANYSGINTDGLRSAQLRGGGVFSNGDMLKIINGSVISGNQALANFSNSYIKTGAHASVKGGGIYSSASTVEVTDSVISGNTARADFVGFANETGSIDKRISSAFASGGGIYQRLGQSLDIVNSTISGNSVEVEIAGTFYGIDGSPTVYGGGISTANLNYLSIQSSTISGNRANLFAGGAIRALDTFSSGGGIHAKFDYSFELLSSTVSGNQAITNVSVPDGFIFQSHSYGAGIFSSNGLSLDVKHSTVAGNEIVLSSVGPVFAAELGGGGIYRESGSLNLDHSIVADNTSRDISAEFFSTLRQPDDISGGVTSANYSIVEDGSVTGPTILNVDPSLAPLADNGGPTFTHALLPGSLALDAGDDMLTAGVDGTPVFDQRGSSFDRIADGDGDAQAVIDIGAYEAQSFTAPPPSIPEVEPNDTLDDAQMIDLDTTFDDVVEVLIDGSLSSASDLDYFKFDLRAGDIFGAAVLGTTIETWTLKLIEDLDGLGTVDPGDVRMESSQNATAFHPDDSLLPSGNSALSQVIEADGTYFLELSSSGVGDYQLLLGAYRPVLEQQDIGEHQILYLDFDGETFNAEEVFGLGFLPSVTLSPLSAFLDSAGWNVGAGNEEALIDLIVANVIDNLSTEIDAASNNPNFEIEILNSWDNPGFDFENDPNASRIIVGGTQNEFGFPTIGLADSIDVGNFDTTETGVVLLDTLSSTNPSEGFSLNNFTPGGIKTNLDLIAEGVGNIIAHEAGHFFGNFHTDAVESGGVHNLMDKGAGGLDNLLGIPDGTTIWSGEDNSFGVDVYSNSFLENIYNGFEDTLNTIAFALTTGIVSAETIFNGTGGDDVLVVSGTSTVGEVSIDDGNVPVIFQNVTRLVINTLGGNDEVIFDYSLGDFFPTGGILFDGGTGEDQVSVERDVDFLLTDSALTIDISTVELASIEVAVLIGGSSSNVIDASAFTAGRVELYGKDHEDYLFGGTGNDILDSGSALFGGGGQQDVGIDILEGGAGDDTYIINNVVNNRRIDDSGGSNDTLDFSGWTGTGGVTVDLGSLAAQGPDQYHTWRLMNTTIENVIGSDYDDIIIGNELKNLLQGGDGNDQLFGKDGEDILRGGLGNDILDSGSALFGGGGQQDVGIDVLEGGDGDDTYIINNVLNNRRIDDSGGANDTLDFSGWNDSAGITANLGSTAAQGPNPYNTWRLMNTTIENVIGSAYDDIITGNELNNLLQGGDGHDQIFGEDGDDTIYGGDGDDTINGGLGFDTAYGGTGTDTDEDGVEDWTQEGPNEP